MAAVSTCLYTTLCIFNTGNDILNDTYIRTGTFNGNSYYIGQTNNYVIFFSSEGYWCVADYIDGPCLLTGKSPCTSVCPDFCDDYYTRGVCPPPEPPPVNPCDIFDFEAIFDCDVPVPTPSATPQCGGIITTSATSPTSIIELQSTTDDVYTNNATLFHSPFNLNGTSPGNIYLAVSTTQPVWKRTNSSNGPLNRSGLWTTDNIDFTPYNTWLGFSVCITVPETKTYWVGIAGDNNFRIAIDGETIVNTIGGPYDGSTFAFIFWHVYPVTLSSGNHVIELFGLNLGGDAAFGCEIYNNTIDELTGATQVSDLNIIFTSAGQTEATIVQNLSGQYLASGYTCPTGYVFDPCTISCFTIIPPCTPTATPTPTATVFCPLSVNATIQSYTPTPTVTPSFTPSSSAQISRDCGFMGDVTFNTINSTIDCPFSLEFQDCYNGAIYYTTNALTRPEGGSLEKFMIYQANVDNVRRCISYVGVNVNIIGSSTINFISNLIGYSNLGQCISCIEILTPTPTPTPSITPTITLTSSSNKPVPPAASNTPTPTRTKPVLYYTYEKCGTNQRVCQPVEAYVGQTIGSVFKTGDSGQYPNTCWSLVSITLSCNTINPNYTTITYSTNVFSSILNTIYNTCSSCVTNTVAACYLHTVNRSTSRCQLCNSTSNFIEVSVYSPSEILTNGSFVYTNPNCTGFVNTDALMKDLSTGNVFEVAFGGNGILTSVPCNDCICKPHVVKLSPNRCSLCNNQVQSTTTVYSNADILAPGFAIYTNSTCLTPISSGQFISYNGTLYAVGGLGVLVNASCVNC